MWVISIILLLSAPMFASSGEGTSAQNKVKSSSQAARIVKSKVGGKVLKVKSDGRSSYKVKVIKNDGHIVNVMVDAKSGNVK